MNKSFDLVVSLFGFITGRVEDACYDYAQGFGGLWLTVSILLTLYPVYKFESIKRFRPVLMSLIIILALFLGGKNRIWETAETRYNSCINTWINESRLP